MRQLLNRQPSLFCQWPTHHEFAEDLKIISEILDEKPEFLAMVGADLQTGKSKQAVGALGMTAEQVLRAALIKQQKGWTYRELAVQCADSEMTYFKE